MTGSEPLVEIWRGDILESMHSGHIVVCNAAGEVIEAWGDPEQIILPRSSCKMIQALPLLESGAGDAVSLSSRHLALACASHIGANIHTELARSWLDHLGLADHDLRCGPQDPEDREEHKRLLCSGTHPDQVHNNCSGKHCGFLTLAGHLGAGPEYNDVDHPVQRAVRTAFEEVTGVASPGYGIDGCSAPNFATSMTGLARGVAGFAAPGSDARGRAQLRLREAMHAHPELVAGETKACTILMRAAGDGTVIKTGAEGVYIGILPKKQLGFSVKISDGATRAAECVIAALLVRHGVLDPEDLVARRYTHAPITSRRGIPAGVMRPANWI